MAANYNNSAWFYDRLSRVVYGRALVKAQVCLLQFVKPGTQVLIVGGGTGWILEELAKIHSTGLTITYVEVAAGMMALSKKRNYGNNRVNFINAAVEDVDLPKNFDVIITPFLFDNFTEQTLEKVFDHLHPLLKSGGTWLNTDFRLTGKWWQQVLLKTMFIFFKIICGIEASTLPEIEKQYNQHGYTAFYEEAFFGQFIISKAYRSPL